MEEELRPGRIERCGGETWSNRLRAIHDIVASGFRRGQRREGFRRRGRHRGIQAVVGGCRRAHAAFSLAGAMAAGHRLAVVLRRMRGATWTLSSLAGLAARKKRERNGQQRDNGEDGLEATHAITLTHRCLRKQFHYLLR
jgi:hypothetical protein